MVLIVVISLAILFCALFCSALLKGNPFIQLSLYLGLNLSVMITDARVK